MATARRYALGKMGHGYGSEWHLTRFLGRHRHRLDKHLARSTLLTDIRWLDFNFKSTDWLGDGELLGLDFLPNADIQREFREWWPHGRGIMNWDAVAEATDLDGNPAWLLIEAKANVPELRSDCGAGPESMARIRSALDETGRALGVTESGDWTRAYYQHANRLAVLHFLTAHKVPAHLVEIYFYGSTPSDNRSPIDAAGWEDALVAMKTYLGLSGRSELETRVHEVFVDVSGSTPPSTRRGD